MLRLKKSKHVYQVPHAVVDVAKDVLVPEEGGQLVGVNLGQQLDQSCVDLLKRNSQSI